MKAVICTRYGPPEVLQLAEVEKPVPRDHEVCIKIYATSAHIGDTRIRKPDPFLIKLMFGWSRPKKVPVLGMELSGVIESVGKDVKSFKPGDDVFAFTGFGFGAYAEFICMPAVPEEGKIEKQGTISLKPENITHGEAATIPAGALTVLKVFQKVDLRKGEKLLVYGASGSLGCYAVQLAKSLGAEVTGVCSTSNLELVKSLGADRVIDYTREDFLRSGGFYDVIFDAVDKISRSKCRRLLSEKGKFTATGGLGKLEIGDLDLLKKRVEEERLKPVIDREYTLDQIVEAHRYVDTGRKKGNVCIYVVKKEKN